MLLTGVLGQISEAVVATTEAAGRELSEIAVLLVRATGDVIPESRGANQTSSRPKYAFIINYHLCKMIQEPLPENPGSSEARDSPDNSLGDAVNIKDSMGLGSFSIMHKSF